MPSEQSCVPADPHRRSVPHQAPSERCFFPSEPLRKSMPTSTLSVGLCPLSVPTPTAPCPFMCPQGRMVSLHTTQGRSCPSRTVGAELSPLRLPVEVHVPHVPSGEDCVSSDHTRQVLSPLAPLEQSYVPSDPHGRSMSLQVPSGKDCVSSGHTGQVLSPHTPSEQSCVP